MSVSSEVSRIASAKASLVAKMDAAGYETGGKDIGRLVDGLSLERGAGLIGRSCYYVQEGKSLSAAYAPMKRGSFLVAAVMYRSELTAEPEGWTRLEEMGDNRLEDGGTVQYMRVYCKTASNGTEKLETGQASAGRIMAIVMEFEGVGRAAKYKEPFVQLQNADAVLEKESAPDRVVWIWHSCFMTDGENIGTIPRWSVLPSAGIVVQLGMVKDNQPRLAAFADFSDRGEPFKLTINYGATGRRMLVSSIVLS